VHQFRRGDLVFDVIDAGPADGPVVILLHGFPQSGTSWAAVIERLTERGFRCLAPDQRGYSPGARPRSRWGYRMPELVEDVRALVDASGADTVHLVGHDWGAAVAWAVAGQYPERLASLTALSVPHPAAMVRAMATSRQGLVSWYMYLFQLPFVPEWVLLGPNGRRPVGLTKFLSASGQPAPATERDLRTMTQPGVLRGALNWYRAIPLVSPRSTDVAVATPTMYVWGDGDVAVARKTAQACRNWVTGPYRFEELLGVSHWTPDEVPDTIADLLLEHFAAYPG
jgi:pimeloyl-ACP methyl ester carboxylesterase